MKTILLKNAAALIPGSASVTIGGFVSVWPVPLQDDADHVCTTVL